MFFTPDKPSANLAGLKVNAPDITFPMFVNKPTMFFPIPLMYAQILLKANLATVQTFLKANPIPAITPLNKVL